MAANCAVVSAVVADVVVVEGVPVLGVGVVVDAASGWDEWSRTWTMTSMAARTNRKANTAFCLLGCLAWVAANAQCGRELCQPR
jgi:uncharacterized membrane protein